MVRHFKNLSAFATRFLKCVGLFYDTAKYRVKLEKYRDVVEGRYVEYKSEKDEKSSIAKYLEIN